MDLFFSKYDFVPLFNRFLVSSIAFKSSEYLQDYLGKILENIILLPGSNGEITKKKHKFHVKQQFSTRFNTNIIASTMY